MSNDPYVLEAGTSGCKKPLLDLRTTSSSNHTAATKSSVNFFQQDVNSRRKAEIRQLEGRLRVLEEEAEVLKGALSDSVEESKRLITEIHQHFHTIRHCLLQRELNRGELYSHSAQIISLPKDRRAGLLQVLCQESNPLIVNKGSRTKSLGYDSTLPAFKHGN